MNANAWPFLDENIKIVVDKIRGATVCTAWWVCTWWLDGAQLENGGAMLRSLKNLPTECVEPGDLI